MIIDDINYVDGHAGYVVVIIMMIKRMSDALILYKIKAVVINMPTARFSFLFYDVFLKLIKLCFVFHFWVRFVYFITFCFIFFAVCCRSDVLHKITNNTLLQYYLIWHSSLFTL